MRFHKVEKKNLFTLSINIFSRAGKMGNPVQSITNWWFSESI